MDFIRQHNHTRFPLCDKDKDHIIGMVHIRDILEHPEDKDAKDFLSRVSREILFVPENKSISDILHQMMHKHIHLAIVVDEYGDLQGIVTLEDILEEIVGDINDESDIQNLDTMGIRKISDNAFIVDGQVPIRDINRKFNWQIADENAVTVAGYLLDMTRSLPEVGQKFIFDGFQFEVVKRNKNQISQIKLTKLEENLPDV